MYAKPYIFNLALTVADTEYSQAIPENASRILVRSRNGSNIKLYYSAGASSYITIEAGVTKIISDVFFKGLVLYMKSADGSDVAEIECWTQN